MERRVEPFPGWEWWYQRGLEYEPPEPVYDDPVEMSWSELGEVIPWYEELPPERWNEGQPHLAQGRTWTWRDEEEERWRRELNRLEE